MPQSGGSVNDCTIARQTIANMHTGEEGAVENVVTRGGRDAEGSAERVVSSVTPATVALMFLHLKYVGYQRVSKSPLLLHSLHISTP